MHSPTYLAAVVAAAVAALLFLIIRLKQEPFVALLLVSMGTALAAGFLVAIPVFFDVGFIIGLPCAILAGPVFGMWIARRISAGNTTLLVRAYRSG